VAAELARENISKLNFSVLMMFCGEFIFKFLQKSYVFDIPPSDTKWIILTKKLTAHGKH